MRVTFFAVVTIAAIALSARAFAGDTEWRRYTIASTGTSVDMPVSIFTSDAGAPEGGGTGRRFFTEDRRADLVRAERATPALDTAPLVGAERCHARHVCAPGEDEPRGTGPR